MSCEQALLMLLRGDTDAGLDLYRQGLKRDGLPDVPVGLHLLFLKRAGQVEAASRLQRMAVEQGADIAVTAAGLGADEHEAAAEYEALFAGGIANSRMIYEYLRSLAKLGRTDRLREILDPDRLLRIVRLEELAPLAAQGGLAASVEALLLELEPRAEPQVAVQSVRNMRMFRKFSELRHPVAAALMGALHAQVESYFADWRSSDHPFANLVPRSFELDAWGLISRGEGYNAHHIHQKGWATGVYYPTGLNDAPGGELWIGRPQGAAASEADWATSSVQPEAGLLVLIPSYYTHWTVPLRRPGLRTSIAFDVLPTFE